MKILLVEDDQKLASLLHRALEQQYQVEVALDGQDGWELAEVFHYDLILLDWMLPRLDGINFCKRLRSRQHPAIHQPNQTTPILLMTALDTVTNKIIGLDAGADDYLVKPFELEELKAHIRVVERRGRTQRNSVLEWQGLQLQQQNCEVTYLGRPLMLTLKEYQILELLLRHPEQIFSQSRLIEHFWTEGDPPTENAVRAQIKGLRHKLTQVGAVDVIETLYKLGYRLKKKGPEMRQAPELSTVTPDSLPVSTPPPKSDQNCVAPDFWQVWLECRDSYMDRVAVIEQAVAAAQQGQLALDLQHQAEREAHTLIGSLGSFGLEEASRLCRTIQRIMQQKPQVDSADAVQLGALIQELRQAMGRDQDETPTPVENLERPIQPLPLLADAPALPLLLIVEDDQSLGHLLAAEAMPWGLQTAIASNLSQARQQILQQVPSVVLLDLSLSESGESGLDFLAEFQTWYPTLPVLVFTASDSLSDRVQAARLGCKGFFQKPIAPAQVLAMISQTLQQVERPHSKLLIVDDDPQLLALLQQILAPEGYDLTLLENAQQFWSVLEQTAPDLIILDLELQGPATLAASSRLNINGFDLCQIIRNDPQWGKLPILFLSANSGTDVVQRGFEVGANDFLHKPISAAELLGRVRKRLEQGQVRRQAEIDELTGVSNRRQSLQELAHLLRLAQRQQQSFSFAVLDLDHFKQVNDQYGHGAGDRVLHLFGHLLSQALRQEDVVGRWGGEEFVVGLYGMSKADGLKRLTEVLQSFRQTRFISEDGRTFQVAFSGGIAQLQEDGIDLQALYRAADAALYQAKGQGRNRILAAEVLS